MKKKQPKKQRARDTFRTWCKMTGQKDYFNVWYSEKVFVAERTPKSEIFIWEYNTKKNKSK